MENVKGALRHLWAAIQIFHKSEEQSSAIERSKMAPVHSILINLDILAQKLVPHASSSLLRIPKAAVVERPFWSRPSLLFPGDSEPDSIAADRDCLSQLICSHNNRSRVSWGSWRSTNERPSRQTLLGFHAEMLLWQANAPSTFASCPDLARIDVTQPTVFESLPIPPQPLLFTSNEAASNVILFNAHLGCLIGMINATDENPAARETELFNIAYQTLQISQGLIDQNSLPSKEAYRFCEGLGAGITTILYHGTRRCFSLEWQQYTITALRSIGREGLSNGHDWANTLEVMTQLEIESQSKLTCENEVCDDSSISPLGFIRNRPVPLLMPRGEDGQFTAYYLRYVTAEGQGELDEKIVRITARATWKQEDSGAMQSLEVHVYASAALEDESSSENPEDMDSICPWRQAVEKGWHGYLT
jgi:hypothetical protein